LVDAGLKVEVPSLYTSTYGTNRKYQPNPDLTTIQVFSGWARKPSGPGKLLAYEPFGPGHTKAFDKLASERSALLDQLAAEARGVKVELAPGGKTIIDREHPGLAGFIIGLLINNLSRDPLTALGDPSVLRLLQRGIVRSPVLDQTKIQRVLDLPAAPHKGAWGDEQVEVHILNPFEAALCARRPCFSPQ
jgi:hypothetical protein